MIHVSDLSFCAGAFRAWGLNLEVPSGQYFVLLGPTGSGKTLFLKCLCGLIRAGSGSIVIEGHDVTGAEPRRRSIGYVPQEAGLFPHMNVQRNITFPLRVRGMDHGLALRRAAGVIDTLSLGPLLDRGPTGLSGGERQKVAVARALAAGPKLLLLDEPASALDGPSRQVLCRELRHVHSEFNIVTVHVCHNLEEATSVADRAGVMCAGRLIQTGAIEQLLARPADQTVARLLGGENIFAGAAAAGPAGASTIALAGQALTVPGRLAGPVQWAIRPEAIRICRDASSPAAASPGAEPQGTAAPQGVCGAGSSPAGPAPNRIRACLQRIENRGAYCRLEFRCDDGAEIVVHASAQSLTGLALNQACALELPAEAIHVFGSR
jgi:ABC-type sugar transport system ATPase subunit